MKFFIARKMVYKRIAQKRLLFQTPWTVKNKLLVHTTFLAKENPKLKWFFFFLFCETLGLFIPMNETKKKWFHFFLTDK